jgi:hypothetical protein
MGWVDRHIHDLEARIEALEKRIEELEARAPYVTVLPLYPTAPTTTPYPIHDCGCAPNTVCNNTACPRRVVITYSGVPDGVGFPD